MDTWSSSEPMAPLGELEGVKARLSEHFGPIEWELAGGAWFGRVRDRARYAELQLSPEGGAVRALTLRRIERADVEAVCRLLEVVGLDDQTMCLFAPETGEWTQEH